jgi:hypothetical protein
MVSPTAPNLRLDYLLLEQISLNEWSHSDINNIKIFQKTTIKHGLATK